MSLSENSQEVQVAGLGPVLPATLPFSHSTQCCRYFSPAPSSLCHDNLINLTLPQSTMATSCKADIPINNDNLFAWKTILQLKKDIVFLKEGHADMLKSLQEEIDDLKQKNQQLQFQLVTGCSALPLTDDKGKEELSKLQQKIDSLQKELQKVKSTLKVTLKSNCNLTNEVQTLRRDRQILLANLSHSHSTLSEHSALRMGRVPHVSSPEMNDYGTTLQQIQCAAGFRNSKSGDGQHTDRSGNYWCKNGNSYLENCHHHPMMSMQHDMRHHEHQLPRLPLRNQLQNYMPRRQDMQYDQLSSNILPSLKQPDKTQSNKQKKSRGPRPSHLVDKACRH